MPLFYLFWKNKGSSILGLDLINYYNPEKNLKEIFYMWIENGGNGFGFYLPIRIFEILNVSISVFLKKLGVSFNAWYKIYYFLSLIIGYIGIFKLLSMFYRTKIMSIKLLLVSYIYILNPFTLIIIYNPVPYFINFMALTPWIAFFYIRIIRDPNSKSLLLFLALSIFLNVAFANLAFLATLVILLLIISVLEIKNIYKNRKILTIYLIIIFLFNSYWTLNLGHFYIFNRTDLFESEINIIKTVFDIESISKYAKLSNIYRGIGGWDFFNSPFGKPSISFSSFYKQVVPSILLFLNLVPFLMIIIDKKHQGRKSIIMGSYLLIIFMISYGLDSLWFKSGIVKSGLYMFRDTFSKFGMLIPFLMTISWCETIKSSGKTAIFFLSLAMLINSYPHLTGQFINNDYYSNYPNEYKIIGKIIDEDFSSNRALKVPIPTFIAIGEKNDTLAWDYWGPAFLYEFTEKRTIEIPSRAVNRYSDKYMENFVENINEEYFCENLDEINIKHILFNNNYYDYLSPNDNEKIKDKYFKIVNSCQKLELVYESNGYYLFINKDDLRAIIDGKNLSFHKNNPTKYSLKVDKIKDKLKINFYDSFDYNWQLYLKSNKEFASEMFLNAEKKHIGNSIEYISKDKFAFKLTDLSYLWRKPIFEDTHELVYDYANGWTIDPEYIKANYPPEYYHENPDGSIDIQLTLYFKPQSYFYLGIIISVTTFTGCIIYLIIDTIKTKRRKKDTNEPQNKK